MKDQYDSSRMTRFLHEQTRLWWEAHRTIFTDSEFLAHWVPYAYTVLVNLELPHPLRQDVESGSLPIARDGVADESELLRSLTDRARQRIPALDHAFGECLAPWIARTVKVYLAGQALHTGDTRTKEALLAAADAESLVEGYQFKRFLPDNPAEVFPTHILFPREIYDDPEADKRLLFWHRQVRDYVRSLRLKKPVGRPKKPAEVMAKPSGRTLDPALAKQAVTMDERGARWPEIARACYPQVPLAERRTDRMRKHIARLIERGAINARLQKKSGR